MQPGRPRDEPGLTVESLRSRVQRAVIHRLASLLHSRTFDQNVCVKEMEELGYRYTEKDKENWIKEGLEKQAEYLLIVCDTFSYEDYPVFATVEDIGEKTVECTTDMQMIHEAVDLRSMKVVEKI